MIYVPSSHRHGEFGNLLELERTSEYSRLCEVVHVTREHAGRGVKWEENFTPFQSLYVLRGSEP